MSENEYPKISLLTDFYIDFLGSLVPGLLAIVTTATVLAWSANLLCHSIVFAYLHSVAGFEPLAMPSLADQIGQWKDVGLGPYGNIGLLLVTAYVLGSIFYRQDPKVPDHKSARRIWRDPNLSREDRERLAVQPTSEQATDISEYDAQFPYFFLREYLEGRGLEHLVKWVSWSGRDRSTWKYRTKMVINTLKVRLQFLLPHRCKDIVRNEAHVRMATSIWYASRWIIITSSIALVMAGLSTAGAILLRGLTQTALNVLGFDIFVLAFALFLKMKIERFIHYMRVREIVYVLEITDFASRNGYSLFEEDFLKKGA
ncbi:MAG: hypothetical protein ACHQT6_08610 [Candidatus Acidiferrales bacterium]